MPPLSEILTFTEEDFCSKKKLCSGGEGVVYYAEHTKHGQIAYKKFTNPPQACDSHEIHMLLQYSKHEFIINLMGILEDEDGRCVGFVMEHMPNGSLYNVIYNPSIEYDQTLVYTWIMKACDGIQYLHDNGVLHRDIKPQNFLIGASLADLKVSDFGLCRPNFEQSITLGVGTPWYMSPEVFSKKVEKRTGRYGIPADVWALTISIYEMLYRKVPYYHLGKCTMHDLFSYVMEGRRPILDDTINKKMKALLEKGWKKDPEKRSAIADFKTLALDLSITNPDELQIKKKGGITPIPKVSNLIKLFKPVNSELKKKLKEKEFPNSPTVVPKKVEEDDDSSDSNLTTIVASPGTIMANRIVNSLVLIGAKDSLPEEINIVVFGNPGSGKSTFINAFANYLKFEELSEIDVKKLIVLIRTKFYETMDDLESTAAVDVPAIGKKNAVSNTKAAPETYTIRFQWGGAETKINFIEMPEIEEHSGEVNQFTANMAIKYLSSYKFIHAFCILLHGYTHVNQSFTYIFKSLARHLHVTACPNIFYIVTRVAATNFTAGYCRFSLEELTKKIEEENEFVHLAPHAGNTFCFENYCFRHLCLIKCGANVAKRAPAALKSWNHSKTETIRFLEQLQKTPPHYFARTVDFNQLRSFCAMMDKPLAEITRDLLINNMNLETTRRNLGSKTSCTVSQISTNVIPLDKVLTVCISPNCLRKKEGGSICHSGCAVPEMLRGFSVRENVKDCKVISLVGMCAICKCSHNNHVQTWYRRDERNTSITYDNVDKLDERIRLMSSLLREIRDFCKIKVQFINDNSIMKADDTFLDYFSFLILNEKNRIEVKKGNEILLKLLQANHDKYMAKNVETKIEPTDLNRMNKMAEELYNKPIIGNYLNQAKNAFQSACTQ